MKADLHLPSSSSSISPVSFPCLYQKLSDTLLFLVELVSIESQRFSPMIFLFPSHPVIPPSNTRSHSLETHMKTRPLKEVSQLKTFTHPPFPPNHPQLQSRAPAVVPTTTLLVHLTGHPLLTFLSKLLFYPSPTSC